MPKKIMKKVMKKAATKKVAKKAVVKKVGKTQAKSPFAEILLGAVSLFVAVIGIWGYHAIKRAAIDASIAASVARAMTEVEKTTERFLRLHIAGGKVEQSIAIKMQGNEEKMKNQERNDA